MPLQVRRGTKAELNAMTQPLANGELVWVTDEKKLYIGDGATASASLPPASGYSSEDAQDAAAALFTSGVHTGISFNYVDGSDRIDATVTFNFAGQNIVASSFKGNILASDSSVLINAATQEIFGKFRGDFNGSIFADDSTMIVDGTNGILRGYLLGDVKGSVFADDSSVIIDGLTGTVNAQTITGPFGSVAILSLIHI